jgi:hypothetical protein
MQVPESVHYEWIHQGIRASLSGANVLTLEPLSLAAVEENPDELMKTLKEFGVCVVRDSGMIKTDMLGAARTFFELSSTEKEKFVKPPIDPSDALVYKNAARVKRGGGEVRRSPSPVRSNVTRLSQPHAPVLAQPSPAGVWEEPSAPAPLTSGGRGSIRKNTSRSPSPTHRKPLAPSDYTLPPGFPPSAFSSASPAYAPVQPGPPQFQPREVYSKAYVSTRCFALLFLSLLTKGNKTRLDLFPTLPSD